MMKNIIQKISFFSKPLCIAVLFIGCDLEIQEEFEFDPALPELVTFEDQTAFEWINTNSADKFNYMIEAIELTGLQDLYNSSDNGRTFLLFEDRAFTDNNQLLNLVTGSNDGNLADGDIDLLRDILMYHVIDEYVDQGPDQLPKLNTHVTFQTLYENADPLATIVTVSRDERFRLNVNYDPVLPSSRRRTIPTSHNYVFGNGIGHICNRYIRIKNFEE